MCRHKKIIPYYLEIDILFKLYFHDGRFEKWLKFIFRSNFFPGNIANIIPRSPEQ